MTATASLPTRASFARRFWLYQAERFPLAGFVPLITVFTFSSAAYSRVARGAPGFVPWAVFVVGAFTSLVFFFLLRVLDEHKDADVDRRYRPELPVPRGLVSLIELRRIGALALVAALILNLWLAPILLLPFLAVAAWAALMTKEFFVRAWLRAHLGVYLVSHMLIMPMIDFYTTGLDWLVAGTRPPRGLGDFLVVTLLNGVLIEIGRKIRPPEGEREGVDSYTRAWGLRRAPAVWLATLLASAGMAWLAARNTGTEAVATLVLTVLAVSCAAPAVAFLRAPGPAAAKRIETASQLWPFVTYLLLGAAPFLMRRLGG